MISENQIRYVAVSICTQLGLDPDESVGGDASIGMTPAEIRESFVGYIPAVMRYVPRWETFRAQAQLAIASHVAVQGVIISGID